MGTQGGNQQQQQQNRESETILYRQYTWVRVKWPFPRSLSRWKSFSKWENVC